MSQGIRGTTPVCSIDGCNKRSRARGLCAGHDRRQRLFGDPSHGGPLLHRDTSPEVRFWSHVDKTNGGDCWIWTSGHNGVGYGQFDAFGKRGYAHRIAYELLIGPIPKGLTIDHLCKNPSCVWPEHLEAVTMRENLMRSNGVAALAARRTHCPQGHPYSAENTYVRIDGRGRQCRTCNRERSNRRYHALKGVA